MKYDGNLQQLVEDSKDPNFYRLNFVRWLVEIGKLEPLPDESPQIYSLPAGEWSDKYTPYQEKPE